MIDSPVVSSQSTVDSRDERERSDVARFDGDVA
jgi:hypothetical protein